MAVPRIYPRVCQGILVLNVATRETRFPETVLTPHPRSPVAVGKVERCVGS